MGGVVTGAWIMAAWWLALAAAAPGKKKVADHPDLWKQAQESGLRGVEPSALEPDTGTWVLRGGTVLTAEGHRFERGYVVVTDGRIADVGEGAGPDVERVVDATGMFVTPGIIDTHSHLGVYPSPGATAHEDGNEMVAPVTAGVWAEHAAWPQDPGFQRAVAGGITTLQILPGSGNLIGGRGVILRPIPARGARAMRFPGAPETLKMACGENPKRVYGEKGGPQTRMGNVYRQRQAFLDARAYLDKWDDASENEEDPPSRDLNLDTLAGVLRGEILPQVHCYRADDMVAMLELADEMGFSIRSFHHAVEAYKIRDLLAERHVAVSTWSDWWGFKLESYDAVLPNAAMVATAGARAIIHSDSPIGIQRLNQEAGKAWYDGIEAGFAVTEDEALRWLTINPAWALGIDGQTGSIEVGKRADLVVWSAHPFSVYARAKEVFIDGRLVFDGADETVWSDFEIGQEASR
jgi:imidazolonepropionase-like amidohydrolase